MANKIRAIGIAPIALSEPDYQALKQPMIRGIRYGNLQARGKAIDFIESTSASRETG